MRSSEPWVAGGAASLAAHAALFVVLAWSTNPGPVEQQKLAEARLDLASYEVERNDAREADVAPDAAAEKATTAASV